MDAETKPISQPQCRKWKRRGAKTWTFFQDQVIDQFWWVQGQFLVPTTDSVHWQTSPWMWQTTTTQMWFTMRVLKLMWMRNPNRPQPRSRSGDHQKTLRAALTELDGADLPHKFVRRAAIMKSVPHFLRGPYRSAMRLAMEEAPNQGGVSSSCCRDSCCLDLPEGATSTRISWWNDLQSRWSHLLTQSRQCAEDASVAMHRKRRRHFGQTGGAR